MLKLSQAQAIVAAAAAEAESLSTPVAVAVVDHQGALVLAVRLDGTKRTCLTMARSKAETAVTATEQTDYLVHPDCLTLFSGCLPIHVGGRLAGGVGVSGAQPEVDERVARAGLSVLASF